jgi:hypothetical protein
MDKEHSPPLAEEAHDDQYQAARRYRPMRERAALGSMNLIDPRTLLPNPFLDVGGPLTKLKHT